MWSSKLGFQLSLLAATTVLLTVVAFMAIDSGIYWAGGVALTGAIVSSAIWGNILPKSDRPIEKILKDIQEQISSLAIERRVAKLDPDSVSLRLTNIQETLAAIQRQVAVPTQKRRRKPRSVKREVPAAAREAQDL